MLQKMFHDMKSSKAFWPTLVTLIAIIILLLLPNEFENPVYDRHERSRARVLSVDNTLVQQAGMIKYGEQVCQVEVLNGSKKGLVTTAINLLTGSLEIDKYFQEGDLALVLVGDQLENGTHRVTMVDHYRMHWEFIIIAAYMITLIVFAGWIGVRAVLSFTFTILCIVRILIPGFLNGMNPMALGLVVIAIKTVVILSLVYGLDKRALAACIGSFAGTTLTFVLAMIFTSLLKIHGTVMRYSESLLYAGYENLNLSHIFIASIFIASSGALMDIAVDITAGVGEVVKIEPNVSRKYAIKAGMNIGKAALGTMTTTLLLAYSGGYIGLLMVFVAQGTPLISILNLNYVSAEIVNTMIGSFGLVTVAPFTAIASGMLLAKKFGTASPNTESLEIAARKAKNKEIDIERR